MRSLRLLQQLHGVPAGNAGRTYAVNAACCASRQRNKTHALISACCAGRQCRKRPTSSKQSPVECARPVSRREAGGGPVAPEPLHQLLWLLGRARILSFLLLLHVALTSQSLPGWAWAQALAMALALASDTVRGCSPTGQLHDYSALQRATAVSAWPQKPARTRSFIT